MSSLNRFEYKDLCPTCTGNNPATGKPWSLGFDLDTSTICCLNGHEFEELPSDAKPEQSTVAGNAPDVAGNAPDVANEDGGTGAGSSGVAGHSLENEQVPALKVSAEEDTAALATLSKQLEEPLRPGVEVYEVSEVSAAPSYALPDKVTLRDPATGCEQRLEARKDPVVVNGVRLSSGDLIVPVTIKEQWAQAVEAEAEAQGMQVADYLSEQVNQYLADYWTSNYAQSR